MAAYRGRHARPEGSGASADNPRPLEQSAPSPLDQSAPNQSIPEQGDPNPKIRSKAKAHRLHFKSAHDVALEANQAPSHSKRKTVAILVSIVLVLALLVSGGIFVYTNYFAMPKIEAGQTVSISIPQGSSTTEIAKILKRGNVISDESTFIKDVQSRQVDSSLKPGSYKMLTLMDTDDLINALVKGPDQAAVKLTIPEGLTIEQTAKIVSNTCAINIQDFVIAAYSADTYVQDYPFLEGVYNNSLEGFLYPKTYDIPAQATADYVIRTLLDQFAIETSKLDLSYATEHNLTLLEVVTIASLIEKETMASEERELVASVIYNRLHEDMRLQIDASVVYALGSSYDGRPLRNSDLEVDSPYNTYQVGELPAGPICSPRIESIQAAAHPADTNYLYYVLTSKEGFHSFSDNFEQFEADKQVYQDLFGIE